KLLQSVFDDAVQVNASDIHIEPQERQVQIRFRIDGVLMPQTQTDSKVGPAMALRLKLMAGLDISEKRLPQDGRFNVRVKDHPVEYGLGGVNPVEGDGKGEVPFSRGLRSALRQDPEVNPMGGMRDEVTAQIGLRAALTGHLVLSTLHTKDALSTPIRLIDM